MRYFIVVCSITFDNMRETFIEKPFESKNYISRSNIIKAIDLLYCEANIKLINCTPVNIIELSKEDFESYNS